MFKKKNFASQYTSTNKRKDNMLMIIFYSF